MKKGWKIKRLADVLELQNGYAFDSKCFNPTDGLPLIRIRSLKAGVETETRFSGDYDKKYVVKAGDLLIGMDGEFGCYDWKGEPSLLNQRVCRLQGFSGELIPRFLFYGVNDYLKAIEDVTGYTTVKHISSKQILEIEFPVPPLAEQQRLVGLLDEAFEGIATAKANAEKNLQNARAIFESHLQSVFTQRGPGWVEKPIGELCERLHQGLNTAGEKVKFYDSGYPIIQTRNIDDGVVELDSKMKFMSEDDWQLYKDKYRPEIGDVFFTNIGTIGKTAIVTTDRDYLIHWNIFKLRPLLGKVTSEFLRYTLEQLNLSGYFEKLQKGGTVDFVTKKMISEALILLPAIAEQKTIVAKLDDLREETQRLARLYEQKLAALGALKKSLLHQAFTGEL